MTKRDGTPIRPSYPSAGRQWFGLLLTIAFVVGFDYARTLGLNQGWGMLYIPLVVFVTVWSGMRMGYISIAFILAYSLLAVQIPASSLYQRENIEDRLLFSAIFFAVLVTAAGIASGKLRVARTRAYESY